jgi:hypothetical protein
VAFESAKESIPAEIDRIRKTDVKGKNAKQQLFQTFTKIDEWNNYLPDHPTIIQFRTLICDILRRAAAQYDNLVQNNNLIRDFIFKFNITLEEKADNDPSIQPFKRWSKSAGRTKDLIKHLEYSRHLSRRYYCIHGNWNWFWIRRYCNMDMANLRFMANHITNERGRNLARSIWIRSH